MQVSNVHERKIPASVTLVGALIDTLAKQLKYVFIAVVFYMGLRVIGVCFCLSYRYDKRCETIAYDM